MIIVTYLSVIKHFKLNYVLMFIFRRTTIIRRLLSLFQCKNFFQQEIN